MSHLTIDRQGAATRLALAISDMRTKAPVEGDAFGPRKGFWEAMKVDILETRGEASIRLFKRAAIHAGKAVLPDRMTMDAAAAAGIDHAGLASVGAGLRGLVGDVQEAVPHAVAAGVNALGAVYHGALTVVGETIHVALFLPLLAIEGGKLLADKIKGQSQRKQPE